MFLAVLCRACALLVNNSVEIVICLFSQSNVIKNHTRKSIVSLASPKR